MAFWDFFKKREIKDIKELDNYYKKVSSNIQKIQDSLGYKNQGIFASIKSELVRLKKEIEILKSSRDISKSKIIRIYNKLKELYDNALIYTEKMYGMKHN
ncbi:hypothetical protein J4404_00415 [Candidatus Woesearchaeota archaeon]|nr:hypothetical protein [Candidatus Woesearchaeota archaeon]